LSTNHSASPFEASTLVDLLRRRAFQHPDKQVFTFLSDGETADAQLTYGELDRQARAIGALLEQSTERGSRALLIFPADLAFIIAFFGCLFGGIIAVPTYPPQTRTKRSLEKLRTIVKDVRPSIILTTSSLLSAVEGLFALAEEDLDGTRLVTTDSIDPGLADSWNPPTIDSETLAFLQYTSGSTGLPKGVMLTHGNLLYNLSNIYESFGITSEITGVSWLPPYHDMGLIGMLLETIYAGVSNSLMAPVAFLQRPYRWLQAMTKTKANMSGGPNFAYDLVTRKVTPEQKATLDLSNWELAFNGAETVRWETFERFAEAFEPCGFRREAFFTCYGMAEGSLIVTGGKRGVPPPVLTLQADALAQNSVVEAPSGSEGARSFVGCGKSVRGQKVVIVNHETLRQCSPDEIGEIWVSGPSVAKGYWQRPQETAETFQGYIMDTGEGPFLRTGDLGFLKDEELFVTGRLKDLIIIRGRNHYPQDIELTVEQSHPALRPGSGVAFSLDVQDEERLMIVQEVERRFWNVDIEEVAESVRKAVAEQHDLQVYGVALIKTASIPKTTSGKLQHRATRQKYLDHELEILSEWTLQLEETWDTSLEQTHSAPEDVVSGAKPQTAEAIQAWLLAAVAQSLHIDSMKINVGESLALYGMDSVHAVSIAEQLGNWLGMQLDPALAYDYPTIESLANYLAGKSQSAVVTAASDDNSTSIRQVLLLTEPLARQQLLEDYIREKIARTLKLSLSGLDVQLPFNSLGIDSLTAMELKNWIEIEMGVDVPVTMFLDEPSLAEFARHLLDQFNVQIAQQEQHVQGHTNGLAHTRGGEEISPRVAEQLLAGLDSLSDEEVNALLNQFSPGELVEIGQFPASNGNGHGNGNGMSPQAAEQLLTELGSLSDEEVEALLSQMVEKEFHE
jgi:acyl-CoA synthetase (AMP-forming)/AMP-acid ligase II/acyl carrier protein